MSINQSINSIRDILSAEREAGRCNSLDDLAKRKIQRDTITRLWSEIQTDLKQLKTDIDSLPLLPSDEQIAWAQTVIAMPNLCLMEIDTTGLDREDEIVRFTLVDGAGQVTNDFHIQPISRWISAEVSAINGVQSTDLESAPTITELWERIRAALAGNYVVSFNQEWDLGQLKHAAASHSIPPLVIVGDCLQRRATQYYRKEYYLKLDELAQRAGHPLPEQPHQTSIDRALAQLRVLQAMASGVTDVRLPKPAREKQSASPVTDHNERDDNDDLDDLDAHPF